MNNERLFSMNSGKAIKAQSFGYLNAILYMAPANMAGVGNLCSHASPACLAACLGWHSGQAAMVKHEEDLNSARKSRIRKAREFMQDRPAFIRKLAVAIAKADRKARKAGQSLCVRLNGSTDVAWEGVAAYIDAETAAIISRAGLPCEPGRYANLMSVFPLIPFVDYTKNPHRIRRALPANYHLTFSRAENNEAEASQILAAGHNVAVVFGEGLPSTWAGYRVIDGDQHDLRQLDPRGVVVGLSPKGRKAKKDRNGFVVRDYAIAA